MIGGLIQTRQNYTLFSYPLVMRAVSPVIMLLGNATFEEGDLVQVCEWDLANHLREILME